MWVAYVIINPQADKSKQAKDQPGGDLVARMVEEDSQGITIRGAKMLATAGVMANEIMVSGIVALQPGDEPSAFTAVTPVATKGLKMHSRRRYEAAAGSAFDYPLSARFDEIDAVVFFDDVRIPWERVLVHRDLRMMQAQRHETRAHVMQNYQCIVRLAVKLRFQLGLAHKVAETNGILNFPQTRETPGLLAAEARRRRLMATLLRAAALIPGRGAPAETPGRVLVRDGVIVATGATAEQPTDEMLDLGEAVLLPGFVNAHQHGRGLPQALLGYPDNRLEAWGNRRRKRGVPDPFPLVRLASLRMLANGVTATLHANWSYGGDLVEELHAMLRGYDAAGLRAAVMISVADRDALVYPGSIDEAAFLASLDPTLRSFAATVACHPFPATAAGAIAIHDQLAARWSGHPRLSLGLGPAGPQWVSDALFAETAAAAHVRNLPLHFQLLESSAQARACAALYPEGTMRRLAALGVLDGNASAAHGVFLTADDTAVMAEHGTTLVANPGSNLRLGCGVPDYAAIRAAGVPLALGGDSCELNDDRDP